MSIAFLDAYYRELASRGDSSVCVACEGDRVIGYVAVVGNQGWVLLRIAFSSRAILKECLRNVGSLISLPVVRHFMTKCFYELFGGKWSHGLKKFDNACEVRSVAVCPEYRDFSVGRSLLHASVHHARQGHWDHIIAWVQEGNLVSRRLFEEAGFQKVGERREEQHTVYLYAMMVDNLNGPPA
jgi:ribosomal protein S18 acetylase RimI-like enzyme